MSRKKADTPGQALAGQLELAPGFGLMRLTPKQERFVQEYLTDLNATQAAIRAGYSARSASVIGHENLRKPNVAAAVEARKKVRADALGITADYILLRLKLNVERAMQVEAVTDREGTPTGEYIYQGSVANRALELLGKLRGDFVEKVEYVPLVDTSKMSDEELEEIASGRGRQKLWLHR